MLVAGRWQATAVALALTAIQQGAGVVALVLTEKEQRRRSDSAGAARGRWQ